MENRIRQNRLWRRARPLIIKGDLAYITLSSGKLAVIDAIDADIAIGWQWHADGGDSPRARIGKLPNLIMSKQGSDLIDHIDRNPLNNRRSNFRRASNAENCRNRGKAKKEKTSVFKGVSFRKDRGTWLSCIRKNGNLRKIGTFTNEVAAAIAYDIAAKEEFGEFAFFNFPGWMK